MDLEIKYLDVSQQTSRVHPACLIDRVSPDVENRFCCPDDPADQGPHRYPDPKHEVVKRVLVDVIQLVVELSSEVYQVTQMIIWIILKKRGYIFVLGVSDPLCKGYIEQITFCNSSRRRVQYSCMWLYNGRVGSSGLILIKIIKVHVCHFKHN